MNLFGEMKRICMFLILCRLVAAMAAGKEYEKYIDFIMDIMILFSFIRLGFSILHYVWF